MQRPEYGDRLAEAKELLFRLRALERPGDCPEPDEPMPADDAHLTPASEWPSAVERLPVSPIAPRRAWWRRFMLRGGHAP
jgi:hypothetical protein